MPRHHLKPHRATGPQTTTLSKDFDTLSAALQAQGYSQADAELSNLYAIANAGSKNNGTKSFIEMLYQWYDNSGSDQAIALGGVNAMLLNAGTLAGNQPGDWPQVLGPYVSYKWGTDSRQWAGLWSLKSMNNGPNLVAWVYMQWANSGYSDTVLQNYLLDPNSVLGDAAAAGYPSGLPNPSGSPPAPPFGPPNPTPAPGPPSHLEEIVLLALGGVVIATSLYFIAR